MAVSMQGVHWPDPGRKWHLLIGSLEENVRDVSFGKGILWCLSPGWRMGWGVGRDLRERGGGQQPESRGGAGSQGAVSHHR